MSLAPAATLTLGSKRYDSHAATVTVELTLLPGVNTARMALPAATPVDAGPGDDAALDLDGGEGAETVITGTIAGLRRGLDRIDVVLGDAGGRLAAFRPAQTYIQQDGSDIVRALAGDAGADVGSVDIGLDLAAYIAHQRRTAAEHVAAIAALAGGIARVDADGGLSVVATPTSADVALRYCREIRRYEARATPAPAARRLAIGNGPAGSGSAPDALRHSVDTLVAGAPAPGASARWTPRPMLRTPAAAKAASATADADAAARTQTIEAHCFLLPQLRPGMVVQVQDLPDGPSAGPWLLRRVTHRLDGRGGRTVFRGTAADAGSLLGSLLGGLL